MSTIPPARRRPAAVLTLAIGLLLAASQNASADIFYGATGSNGIDGRLYTLDPATGAVVTNIGALVDASSNAYGLTGLAFQPGTGVLYGSTTNASTTAPGHLVRVNAATGQITDVGSYGVNSTMSDISFDVTTGLLFGWRSAGSGLFTINTVTGAATLVGGVVSDFGGGGLAVSLTGTIFSTNDGSTAPNPTLQTINKATGAHTTVGVLTGAPFTFPVHNALDFDSAGNLYGVETNQGFPTATRLVRINTTTAAVTNLGASVNDLDALAIFRTAAVPEPSPLVLAGATAGIGVLARWLRRRRSL